MLLCYQVNSQGSIKKNETRLYKIEVNTLPQLFLLADTIKAVPLDSTNQLDTLIEAYKVEKPKKITPKKKRKKALSKNQKIQIEEKKKWEHAVNQQSRKAIVDYLKSSEGTNLFLQEASKKLEEFKIIKTDTFLYQNKVNYTFVFKGTEGKVPLINVNESNKLTIKEQNSSFIIISTNYNYLDTVSFSIENSNWKTIPVYFSTPSYKPSTTIVENEKNSTLKKPIIIFILSLSSLWLLSFLFNKNKTPENQNIEKETPLYTSLKGIAIERIDERNRINPSLQNKARTDTYPVRFKDHWEDSMVADCIFGMSFIEELQYFLFGQENKNKVETVELGGFILGTYDQNSLGDFSLNCHKFVGIESEEEDLYKMGFGSQAWLALEKVMAHEKYKNLDLLGWFHTHPGHGVFLSKPDLNICNNFFPKPYQFAMVIDTIKSSSNKKFNLGLFTKKKNGKMNNVKEKKKAFIQWQEVVQKTFNT